MTAPLLFAVYAAVYDAESGLSLRVWRPSRVVHAAAAAAVVGLRIFLSPHKSARCRARRACATRYVRTGGLKIKRL